MSAKPISKGQVNTILDEADQSKENELAVSHLLPLLQKRHTSKTWPGYNILQVQSTRARIEIHPLPAYHVHLQSSTIK